MWLLLTTAMTVLLELGGEISSISGIIFTASYLRDFF
jgi:hypothetical protein